MKHDILTDKSFYPGSYYPGCTVYMSTGSDNCSQRWSLERMAPAKNLYIIFLYICEMGEMVEGAKHNGTCFAYPNLGHSF